MNLFLKFGLILLIWFCCLDKTNAQIFAYDGRSEAPTIKINKNIIYKKGKVVGKMRPDTIYDYLDSEFVPTLVMKKNEFYFLDKEDYDVDVVEEFAYILINNKIYFSRDTTDFIYLSFKDKFVYRGPVTGKKIVKIEGEYKFIDLIAILYFLEKI